MTADRNGLKHSHGAYVPAPARGDCKSGKVQYATRKQARQASKKLPGETLGTYPCPRCGWFHVGHVPQRVRNGEIDKDAWLDTKLPRRRRRKPAGPTPNDLARILNRKQEQP